MAILSLLLSALLAAEFGPQPGEILLVGTYDAQAALAHADGSWLALVEHAGRFELRETVVKTRRTKTVCGADGFEVSAQESKGAVILIRGLPAVRPKPVPVAFHGDKFLHPGEQLSVRLEGDNYWLLQAFGTAQPGATGTIFRDYQIQLGRNNRSAVVFSLPRLDADGLPRILWIGDLDSDGVPDILADVRTHYAAAHYALFLSSKAKTGEVVAQAASLRIPGC